MPDNQKCPILVCGATGRQGGAVARALMSKGWPVRALTRHPESAQARRLQHEGAGLVRGDLGDPASLIRAMSGAYGVFGVTEFWEHGLHIEIQHGKNLIAAAEQANIKHLVFSSVGGTDRTAGLNISHFDSKRAIEETLRQSTIPWTILRPVTFLENFISHRFRNNIVTRGVLPFGITAEKPFQMIAMQDLAHFVALAFQQAEAWQYRGTELASDQFTLTEFAAALSEALQRPVTYRYLPSLLQRLIAGYAELTDNCGCYKIGKSLVTQFRWNNADPHGGWQADLSMLRALHPDLLTLRDWIATVDWRRNL